MYKKLYNPRHGRAKIAQLMSGSGTNVTKVIQQEKSMGNKCPYETVVIVTDDKRSNALEIARKYKKPFVEFDIRDFQEARGLDRRLSLETADHRIVRKEYTEKLAEVLYSFHTDFAVFGGFEPLTNITEEFICLNVHPGDLTYLKDGKRYLVGLHTVPIKGAREEGIGYVRSSVILAMPYTGKGKDMDTGPLLGLGPKLYYEDETDDKKIQKALKKVSDWKILPAVVLAVGYGEIEVDYKKNEARNPVIMDLEYRISEVK